LLSLAAKLSERNEDRGLSFRGHQGCGSLRDNDFGVDDQASNYFGKEEVEECKSGIS
jgi:hypothetical protein